MGVTANTQAEYLDFKSFCELVATLKPILAWHMNCKSQSDSVELNDSENQFSITEKAIQDACNLSSMLDASKANPIMEGWEISKVTVLLLDSKKENCFLRFGSVNDGETTPSNSHPHIPGAGNDFLVVHNGVIINYEAFKETPIRLDFTFDSETDTEVIPKLAKFVFDKAKEGRGDGQVAEGREGYLKCRTELHRRQIYWRSPC
nr:uncharacterized protein LOC109161584 isoform X3 [Ipomoea batatas]